METTVRAGQSFFDKVLEQTGSVGNAFDMALKNNISVTDELENGQALQTTAPTNKAITGQWNEKRLPATALTSADQSIIIPVEGIGFMVIEETFIVG